MPLISFSTSGSPADLPPCSIFFLHLTWSRPLFRIQLSLVFPCFHPQFLFSLFSLCIQQCAGVDTFSLHLVDG